MIDDEDYWKVLQYSWYVDWRGYACNRRIGYMHHLVYGKKERLDHKDGNKLNMQKSNLRPATQLQNVRNQKKTTSPTSSRFKGVSRYKYSKTKHWIASITVNYKHIHIGVFETEEEAALAYNEKAVEYFGEFAKLNVVEMAAERRMGA